jgi:uncharacterized protein YfaT (DUF1175 family)
MRFLCLFLLAFASACGRGPKLTIGLSRTTLPADGFSVVEVSTSRPAQLRLAGPDTHSARLEGNRIVAGINPGRVTVEASAPGQHTVRAALELTPTDTDRYGDGTPDYLRLDDRTDRDAFLDNITAIARTAVPSPEITDCSSFIRHAYREALRGYEGRAPLKYQFPFTPVGPRIFHTPAGPAEFADAETLARFNTHRVTRDVTRAAPGDLLFFRQPDQKSPWHVMIVCGTGRLCYHTGPDRDWPGEIRRPTLEELRRHELPKWRPFPGNENFLGVFRWNILRQDS